MKVTVLMDNNVRAGHFYLAEPAFSLLIETDGKRILFDAGYSEAVLENARRLDVDLTNLDYLVISHGHLDHTWGLEPLMRFYSHRISAGRPPSRPVLLAHPDAFVPKRRKGSPVFGSLISLDTLGNFFDIQLSRDPIWITDDLAFLGEIERVYDFERAAPLGEVQGPGGYTPDPLTDDTGLAWRGKNGLVLLSGCAHSGVCSMAKRAMDLFGETRFTDVLGGLHLQNAPQTRIEGTGKFLKSLGLESVHACHCTDLAAKIGLSAFLPVPEVAVGMRFTYE